MKSDTAAYFGAIVGFGNKKDEDRNDNDFYPTPPIATYSLLRTLSVPYKVWEPAAGMGHIARELRRCGKSVIATDLYDYDKKVTDIISGVDFLRTDTHHEVDAIITNPPYKDGMAEAFVRRMLDLRVDFAAVLCRLQFACSDGRFKRLYRDDPPTSVLIFPKRINCNIEAANSLDAKDHIGGMLEYAWYVWDRRLTRSHTEMSWIDMDRMVEDWNREVRDERKEYSQGVLEDPEVTSEEARVRPRGLSSFL